MRQGRDILGGFGPDHNSPQRGRASSGGTTQAKELPYSPPQGPIGISRVGVGLGGVNHGNSPGKSTPARGSGSPGIGGTNKGNCGSQRC